MSCRVVICLFYQRFTGMKRRAAWCQTLLNIFYHLVGYPVANFKPQPWRHFAHPNLITARFIKIPPIAKFYLQRSSSLSDVPPIAETPQSGVTCLSSHFYLVHFIYQSPSHYFRHSFPSHWSWSISCPFTIFGYAHTNYIVIIPHRLVHFSSSPVSRDCNPGQGIYLFIYLFVYLFILYLMLTTYS